MPSRIKISRIQWIAVVTAVFAVLGALSEASRDVRSASVLAQSALGLAAAGLAWFHLRWGGRIGVLWGIAQAVVFTIDGNGWVGRQILATYVGTRSSDPATASGTIIAVNAIGGFFACVWAWLLMKERWRTGPPGR
jgi:hypothetical protein